MKTIAYLTFLLLSLFLSQKSTAVNLGVDSIRVIPTTVTKNDSVEIRLYTHTTTIGYQAYINTNVTPGNIWITGCYKMSLATGTSFFADTFKIGKLAEGQYQINFLGYVSIDSQCTNIVDSTKATDTIVVQAPESVNSLSINKTGLVYPNPTSSDVNILLPDGVEIGQIAVHDITGRVVKTETGSRFSIAELPTGLYILQVQTNAGRFVQKLRKE